MDFTSKKTMNKDEVLVLIGLIEADAAILTSKETNARINQLKEDSWLSLTYKFNADSGTSPRTQEQLKLKWDNLKKAARKRSQHIRMNHLKPGFFIQPDEVLDRVTRLLGLKLPATCLGFAVPFGDDSVGCDVVAVETPSKGVPVERRNLVKRMQKVQIMPQLSNKKGLKKADFDGRLARNLTISRYYKKRTEKLELEIELLKIKLAKEQHNNSNLYNSDDEPV